ncbi:tRNA wybutosine-synthesizing protein 3 homolog isoform X1 [Egretta garzetta]|nr:tRNA wybutosine-synthesizing protein 3 homolog isoform X1 [Egretta garzetta]
MLSLSVSTMCLTSEMSSHPFLVSRFCRMQQAVHCPHQTVTYTQAGNVTAAVHHCSESVCCSTSIRSFWNKGCVLPSRKRAATMTALEKATGDVVLKFEPFILHVLCQELQDAQLLHAVAIDSGFRNSGITVGRGGKIMMAVRSTHCLEVPLSHKGKLMVSEEYIEFLIHVANRKMEENTRRIDRFYKCLELALKTAVGADSSPSEETEKDRSVYIHRRKRKTVQEQDVHTSTKDHKEELEPEDDSESNLDIFAEIVV